MGLTLLSWNRCFKHHLQTDYFIYQPFTWTSWTRIVRHATNVLIFGSCLNMWNRPQQLQYIAMFIVDDELLKHQHWATLLSHTHTPIAVQEMIKRLGFCCVFSGSCAHVPNEFIKGRTVPNDLWISSTSWGVGG